MAWVHPLVEKIIAGEKGVRRTLRDIRDDGYAKARTLHGAHNQPGGSKITKSSGRIDYFWSLEDADDGRGEPAAAAIEFGWTTRNGKPVEGLHIIRRSAGRL